MSGNHQLIVVAPNVLPRCKENKIQLASRINDLN